jgi:hypothetical protein
VGVLAACATCTLTRKRSWSKSSCAAYRVLVSRPPPFVRRRTELSRGGTLTSCSAQATGVTHATAIKHSACHMHRILTIAAARHQAVSEVFGHTHQVLQYEGSSSSSCPVKLADTPATAVTAPGRATRCGRHSRLRVFRRSAACVAGARGPQGAHARFAGAAGERPPRPRPHLSRTSVSTWALGSRGIRARR